jgi:hypothetical protein
MPGKFSNFMKNIGKIILEEKAPFINLASALATGYNIYDNFSKFDDPNITDSEKGQAVYNLITTPLSFIPIVGDMANIAGTSASYINDVLSGKKDPPPTYSDVGSHNNPIGNIPNKVISSPIFQNFFRKF